MLDHEVCGQNADADINLSLMFRLTVYYDSVVLPARKFMVAHNDGMLCLMAPEKPGHRFHQSNIAHTVNCSAGVRNHYSSLCLYLYILCVMKSKPV